MAPGYVIAMCLEGAGLIGLVLAALALRAERRARSAELRGFLRSGQAASAEALPAPRRTAGKGRAADLPVVLAAPGAQARRNSPARVALGRALGLGGARPAEQLSAG